DRISQVLHEGIEGGQASGVAMTLDGCVVAAELDASQPARVLGRAPASHVLVLGHRQVRRQFGVEIAVERISTEEGPETTRPAWPDACSMRRAMPKPCSGPSASSVWSTSRSRVP